MRFGILTRKALFNTAVLRSVQFSTDALMMEKHLTYSVRRAENTDLPTIHGLIKDSYAALNDFITDPVRLKMISDGAQSVCDNELNEIDFQKTYFQQYGFNFWVVEEQPTARVLGCCALKRY